MDERQNILLMRLTSFGDVLFTLPAVHRMRASFPRAQICFLVAKEYAPLLAGFREVDSVIPLDRERYRRFNPKAMVGETLSVLRELRRHRFSLALDFQGHGETALLTWCSGAPQRWGIVYRPIRKWAYTRGMRRDDSVHMAERNLALLHHGGLPPAPVRNEFVLPESALDEARRFFPEHGLHSAWPTLFIQPFTSSPQKNWPLEGYLATARHWQSRGMQVLFGGGPADRTALEPARRAGFAVAAGAPLLLSAGLAKLSALVLGGDTGLLHLAVALGRRVVMIMGSAGPGSSYPFGHPDWAVVPPDGRPSSTPIDAVNEACARAFAEMGMAGP